MASPDTLAAPDDLPVPQAGPLAAAEAAGEERARTAAPRFPQLIPVAQLVAVVLGVFAIIWNQQQSIDTLRAEFTAAHNELRTELTAAHNELRTELRTELTAAHSELRTELRTEMRTEFDKLSAQVAENGERLARIEGFLGIGIPDPPHN